MARVQTYSPQTRDAVRVLGLEIARARRERRWTIDGLAERVGVSHVTVRSVEKGAVTVSIGTVFEIATVLGIDLFGAAPDGLSDLVTLKRQQLALLPDRVRSSPRPVDDDF
ncbi:helix-turn-helix transcriptional regulator [Aeromicrobium sp. P5_D10]